MHNVIAMHAIEPKEFVARWRTWYPGASPLGPELQEAYQHRWLRIHSLPGSKRLPDTEAEYSIIVKRHNTVVEELIGTAECVLLGYDYDGVYTFPSAHPLARWLPDSPPVMRVSTDDESSEPISIFVGRGAWYRGMLDGPMENVADDQLRFMLLNWDTGSAYAPYDGGADLFWPTELERDRARIEFGEWLSPDPSGL
jgi:hypothetical protein